MSNVQMDCFGKDTCQGHGTQDMAKGSESKEVYQGCLAGK